MSVDKQLPAFDIEHRGGAAEAERALRTDIYLDLALLVQDATRKTDVMQNAGFSFYGQTQGGAFCEVTVLGHKTPAQRYMVTPSRMLNLVPHNSAYECERLYIDPTEDTVTVAYGERVSQGQTKLWSKPQELTTNTTALTGLADYVSSLLYAGHNEQTLAVTDTNTLKQRKNRVGKALLRLFS